MSIIRQVNLKAEHSPYWLTLYETHEGVFMEDIFSTKDKKPAEKMQSWEAAIIAAMSALDEWVDKIEGFENYITVEDCGWTDIVIAYSTLSELYPLEAERLKKLLASNKYFDTGKSWSEETHRSLRILAVADRLLLEVSGDLPAIPTLIRQCVSSEDEIKLSDDLIEEITDELEDHPSFKRKVTVKDLIPRDTPYAQIMERIALLEQRVESRLDEARGACSTVTQNYLHGSLLIYSVVVQIPNAQQRGLIVAARSAADLFQKITEQIDLGHDATVTYSQVLNTEDILCSQQELGWEHQMGTKTQFQWKDISFSDEILEQEGKLNFYVPVTFDYMDILGMEYGLLGDDPDLNVYASYDLKAGQVCDNLLIVIKYTEGCDEEHFYALSRKEKDLFLQKMDAYCLKQTGKHLSQWNEIR